MTAPEKKLGARAAQRLDALRAAIVRANEARAAQVADAAQTTATDHLAAADAWDALARHATTQASDCRRGTALADRTRRRWATRAGRYRSPGRGMR